MSQELNLDELEKLAALAMNFQCAATPRVVQALIARIRELERAHPPAAANQAGITFSDLYKKVCDFTDSNGVSIVQPKGWLQFDSVKELHDFMRYASTPHTESHALGDDNG